LISKSSHSISLSKNRNDGKYSVYYHFVKRRLWDSSVKLVDVVGLVRLLLYVRLNVLKYLMVGKTCVSESVILKGKLLLTSLVKKILKD
jgi:hypothetical protein